MRSPLLHVLVASALLTGLLFTGFSVGATALKKKLLSLLLDDPAERAAFRKATGQELAPPRTWAEYHELAELLNRQANSDSKKTPLAASQLLCQTGKTMRSRKRRIAGGDWGVIPFGAVRPRPVPTSLETPPCFVSPASPLPAMPSSSSPKPSPSTSRTPATMLVAVQVSATLTVPICALPFTALPNGGECIRVTVGPWSMMERFLAALKVVMER